MPSFTYVCPVCGKGWDGQKETQDGDFLKIEPPKSCINPECEKYDPAFWEDS